MIYRNITCSYRDGYTPMSVHMRKGFRRPHTQGTVTTRLKLSAIISRLAEKKKTLDRRMNIEYIHVLLNSVFVLFLNIPGWMGSV
jgi:hypothetical protein